MKKVIITGATGLLGKKLCPALQQAGYQVHIFTRSPEKAQKIFSDAYHFTAWNASARPQNEWAQSIDGAYAVIHLAGATVAKRWTAEWKQQIMDSRVNGTMGIAHAIAQAAQPPQVFFSASAIGYYGSGLSNKEMNESDKPGNDFLAQVCVQWEQAAQIAAGHTRLVQGRIGVVLDPHEGALSKMLPAFKLFAGGPTGSGKQWMSWIHPDDIVGFILFALNNSSVQGVYNLTAPEPVTMQEFARQLGSVLQRPSWFPVPDFILNLVLGEGAIIATSGQKAMPRRMLESGYGFRYAHLVQALQSLL
jgi:uncharacterized protein (TIGR01777 family)